MKLHLFIEIFSRQYYRKKLFLKTIGNFLIFSSVVMLFRVYSRPVYYEIKFWLDQKRGIKYEVKETQEIKKDVKDTRKIEKGALARTLGDKKVKFLVPKDPEFSIVIPKISANAKIISNVDPADEKEYLEKLKKGVAHAKGTAFPGEGGHIYLFAHSTDYIWNVGTYNAVFYLLYKLEPGDEVDLFYKGKRYVYKVIGKTIVDPERVEYLTRKTNKEFLTLQTCWPPGTTLKRLLVFAVKKEN